MKNGLLSNLLGLAIFGTLELLNVLLVALVFGGIGYAMYQLIFG